MSYVQLKDTAGSGGVILRPTKLFLLVFCRADHSAPFEHPRFALISKMAIWRLFLQSLFRRIRATSAYMSYVQLKDTAGSGGIILGPTKLFLPVFCRADHFAPFEHPQFAWISKMAISRLFLQSIFRRIRATSAYMSYVQLKDTAGSGGVILGPTKLFLPVFCRADHFAPFEHPQFAWISKMAISRLFLQSIFRRIRATSAYMSYVQLKDTAGSGGVILGPTKLFSPVFCRAYHSALYDYITVLGAC